MIYTTYVIYSRMKLDDLLYHTESCIHAISLEVFLIVVCTIVVFKAPLFTDAKLNTIKFDRTCSYLVSPEQPCCGVRVQNGQKRMGLIIRFYFSLMLFALETVSIYQCCFILDFHIHTYDLTYTLFLPNLAESSLYST